MIRSIRRLGRVGAAAIVIGVAAIAGALAFFFVDPFEDQGRERLDEPPYINLDIGEVAPTWSGALLDGGTLRLSALRGRPVLVALLAEWCDKACDVLSQVQEVHQNWSERVAFVVVFVDSKKASLATRPEKTVAPGSYAFPVVVDPSRKISRAWGVGAVPTWVLLDATGRVVEIRGRTQTAGELSEFLAGAAR